MDNIVGTPVRRAILALMAAAVASLGMVAVASAGSSHAEAVLEESDGGGGEIEKATEPKYCEAPVEADRSEVEAAPEAGPGGVFVELASEPGYCSAPPDASSGEVEPKG